MSLASEDVLVWVNGVREEFAVGPPLAELPKGRCSNNGECPIARAIKGRAYDVIGYAGTGPDVFLSDAEHRVHFPEFIAEFIYKFDHGEYPDLIEAAP